MSYCCYCTECSFMPLHICTFYLPGSLLPLYYNTMLPILFLLQESGKIPLAHFGTWLLPYFWCPENWHISLFCGGCFPDISSPHPFLWWIALRLSLWESLLTFVRLLGLDRPYSWLSSSSSEYLVCLSQWLKQTRPIWVNPERCYVCDIQDHFSSGFVHVTV